MDWIAAKESLSENLKKYRSILLVILVGILFMLLPEKNPETEIPAETTAVQEADLEASLAEILSSVSGAGRVEILLTQQEGERTVYQSDDVRNGTDIRSDTVLVADSSRSETGLIRQVIPPVYRGAIILCQGADNPQVRLAVVEAVKSVTGLTTDRITVLKMK